MAQTDSARRRGKAPLVAAGYVGVVAALALAHGAAGAPEGWSALLSLVTFPGSVLVALAAFYLLPALVGGGVDLSDETVGPLDFLPQYAGGALVNVLLAWGVCAFVRHFVREARRSRNGH
ncbi:hypothetical protein [Streptomyces roseolilacinus]|uniref:Uncharacterized protein n=1 Tax=Streptomyces roseolilacinus TaxID=66904 RepID=A0A918AYV8_9ACTN|nr:hypothetical protein [Streptomyces roseolilacinus]GGQ03984.1 hypothetical protein GCM10010249_22960 [Streptomyces roseolilacinus]